MVEEDPGGRILVRSGGLWRWLPWLNALISVLLSIIFFAGTGIVHRIIGFVAAAAAAVWVWLGLRLMSRPVVMIENETLSWGPALARRKQSVELADLAGVVWQNKSLISFSTRSGGSYVLNLTQVGRAQRRKIREILNGRLPFEIPSV